VLEPPEFGLAILPSVPYLVSYRAKKLFPAQAAVEVNNSKAVVAQESLRLIRRGWMKKFYLWYLPHSEVATNLLGHNLGKSSILRPYPIAQNQTIH